MPWLSEFELRQLDDTYFQLTKDLVFYSEKYGLKILVPEGFVSDGPSVPRFPLMFLLFGHKGKRAAVVHDWLYRNKLLPREQCDAIFREALQDSGKFAFTSFGMYAGVRVGGYLPYKNGKIGCLDPRTFSCPGHCYGCPNLFESYALTVTPYRRGL